MNKKSVFLSTEIFIKVTVFENTTQKNFNEDVGMLPGTQVLNVSDVVIEVINIDNLNFQENRRTATLDADNFKNTRTQVI